MTRTADPDARPFDTVLHRGALVSIGKFRADPSHPRFTDSGPTQGHLVVFPRTLVRIAHEGAEGFLAGPEVVTYYNRGQVYRRESVGGRPDRCEWFSFSPAVLADALRDRDPGAAERADAPFSFATGPSDPVSYLAQRRVVQGLSDGILEPEEAEETMLGVLPRLLSAVYDRRELASDARAAGSVSRSRADKKLAEAAREELGRTFRSEAPLFRLAAGLGVSVFRLCRVFRRETGTTLHACRRTLRLAAALELLPDSGGRLTDVALGLGYSSHSHFTAEFRRQYGVTPTGWNRARAPVRRRA